MSDPSAELHAALAAGDEARIVRAIHAWADDVRDRGGHTFALCDALPPLVDHRSAKVRQAVAEAADLFSTSLFDHVAARFQKDIDHFVRAAITRSAKTHAARLAKKAKSEAQEKALAAALERAEGAAGPKGRRLARQAARRSSEYFMRQLHHEATKVLVPLETSLARARSEASRRDLDRGSLQREIEAAIERSRYLFTILDRARDATLTVKGRFRDETDDEQKTLLFVPFARSKTTGSGSSSLRRRSRTSTGVKSAATLRPFLEDSVMSDGPDTVEPNVHHSGIKNDTSQRITDVHRHHRCIARRHFLRPRTHVRVAAAHPCSDHGLVCARSRVLSKARRQIWYTLTHRRRPPTSSTQRRPWRTGI